MISSATVSNVFFTVAFVARTTCMQSILCNTLQILQTTC